MSVVGEPLTIPPPPGRLLPRRPQQEIDRLHDSSAVTVLLVVGFNLAMLGLLEVRFVSFMVAPRWTPPAIARAKARVGRHSHMSAARGFAAVGAPLVLKGLIGPLS